MKNQPGTMKNHVSRTFSVLLLGKVIIFRYRQTDRTFLLYIDAMLILGLILSLTCLVLCSKNGSSSSDFIVNATQRNLSCKDFLRNIEIEWEQWVVERRWQYWARHYRSRHQLMPVMAPQFAPPLSSLAPVVNIFKVVGLLFAMSR